MEYYPQIPIKAHFNKGQFHLPFVQPFTLPPPLRASSLTFFIFYSPFTPFPPNNYNDGLHWQRYKSLNFWDVILSRGRVSQVSKRRKRKRATVWATWMWIHSIKVYCCLEKIKWREKYKKGGNILNVSSKAWNNTDRGLFFLSPLSTSLWNRKCVPPKRCEGKAGKPQRSRVSISTNTSLLNT